MRSCLRRRWDISSCRDYACYALGPATVASVREACQVGVTHPSVRCQCVQLAQHPFSALACQVWNRNGEGSERGRPEHQGPFADSSHSVGARSVVASESALSKRVLVPGGTRSNGLSLDTNSARSGFQQKTGAKGSNQRTQKGTGFLALVGRGRFELTRWELPCSPGLIGQRRDALPPQRSNASVA
jgi:hypothetical protein